MPSASQLIHLHQVQPWKDTSPPSTLDTGYRPHPWTPVMEYKEIKPRPIPSQPITNSLIDPCYGGIVPLKYPNIVTGFDRAPEHAARTALYTRYTPYEWEQNTIANYKESDSKRNYSERVRNDIVRCVRETDEKTTQGQRDANQRIGERITDVTFWRNELDTELERLVFETDQLITAKRTLERSLQGCEGPLHIVQECLYNREKRQGIELVHDAVEQSLLKEVENLRTSQNKFSHLLDKTNAQIRDLRAIQHEIEVDLRNKESALGIDSLCHHLNNSSRGIQYYAGIEKYDPNISDRITWADASSNTIQRSQADRAQSSQIRSDTENLINVCASNVWDNWSGTNNALAKKSSEALEMKNKLQLHLHKIHQEIFDVEKTMELLSKAIQDKMAPMKVTHTRLQARSNRPHLEKCRDGAHNRLVQEACDIDDSITLLRHKYSQAESTHQALLAARDEVEKDLASKSNTLFIDRDVCGGLRRGYPIASSIKY